MKSCSLFLIFGQLFLSGCGMFHQTTRNSSVSTLKNKEETEISDQSKDLHRQDIRSLTIRNDSSNAFSQIEIWPKGKFGFSPGQGFSGQAEKVLIYKKTKSGNSSIEKKEEVAQRVKVSNKAESRIKAKDLSRKDTEKKSSPLSVWQWLLVLIGILFLWYIVKYQSIHHS